MDHFQLEALITFIFICSFKNIGRIDNCELHLFFFCGNSNAFILEVKSLFIQCNSG